MGRPENRVELVRLYAALTWLLETSAALLPVENLEQTLNRYLVHLLDWLGAEQGSIMLRQADELVIVASRGLSPEVTPGMKVRLEDGPAGEAVAQGTPRLLHEPLLSRRTHHRPTSAMIIPIRARERIIGVLNVGKVSTARQFTPEELQMTSVLALQLAWILSNFEQMAQGTRERSEMSLSDENLIERMAVIVTRNGQLTREEGAEFGRALAGLAARIEHAVEILRQLMELVNPQASPENFRLTPRELEMLSYLGEGRSNAEIAKRCWISENTVKFHMKNLFRKLDVRDRGQAMMIARAMRGRVDGIRAVS